MTTSLDRLALRSPDALVAALPYLLGFHPEDSAVVLWLRDTRILLTQRIDLPDPAAASAGWLAALWAHRAAQEADEIVVVLASKEPVDPALVAALVAHADREALHVRDVLTTDGQRWRSLMCEDPECCPSQGRPIDAGAAAAVGAEFALLGRAPLASRSAVVGSLAVDEDTAARVGAALAGRRRPDGRSRERWRDRGITALLHLLGRDPGAEEGSTAADLADLVCWLGDIRVRDTILWEATHWEGDDLLRAADALGALLRVTPAGHRAPVGTTLAALWWLSGDGTRAQIAVDRALADDAEYSLAQLIGASIRSGLPPQVWREAMSALTRADCRHGSAA